MIFHDKMDPGFTFTQEDANKITVQLNGADLAKDKYTVEFNAGGTVPHVSNDIVGDCTFHIRFSDTVFETLSTPGTITLTIAYSATLNENAVICDDGVKSNNNVSRVSYGDKFHATPESITKTRTYGFKVFKYDGSTDVGLSETKFELHKNTGAGTVGDVIHLIQTKSNSTEADEYRVAKPTAKDEHGNITAYETGAITEITTNATGRFIINGLDEDTYHLVETKAKDGYNILPNPVAVEIRYDNGKVNLYQDSVQLTGANTDTINIPNGSGLLLPSTGGIGTTIFYVAGAVLLIGAAILLIVKKRMKDEE